MRHSEIRAIVETGLPPLMARLHAPVLGEVAAFAYRRIPPRDTDLWREAEPLRLAVLQCLMQWVRERLKSVDSLREAYDRFALQYSHAATASEQNRHVLEFAASLGASPAGLRRDRRALRRFFGIDAVSERYHRRTAEAGRDIAFVLQRIGAVCAADLNPLSDPRQAISRWRRLDLESLVKPLLAYRESSAVRIAAFHALAAALGALPLQVRGEAVDDATMRYIFRASLDRRLEIALQCEALSLLAEISPDSLRLALIDRMAHVSPGDDLFVRRAVVRLVGRRLRGAPELSELLDRAAKDPSPAVRQVVVPALGDAEPTLAESLLCRLALEDAVAQVRAAALHGVLELLTRSGRRGPLSEALAAALRRETDEFVLRVALKVVSDAHAWLADRDGPAAAEDWAKPLLPELGRLHREAASLSVRRFAADAHEHLWVRSDAWAWNLAGRLAPFVSDVEEARPTPLPAEFDADLKDPRFGRVLAWLARKDFGIDVEPGRCPRVIRGHRFAFRLWRFLHEMRHPSSDKRQAFRHTVGRVFRGTLRAPSGILSELAMTKVPGEPLHWSQETGWRPYLPLVDEMLSSLDQSPGSGPLRLYTAEGVTEVHPPSGFLRRLRARFLLTDRFPHYAALRNWDGRADRSPGAYVEALRSLGFGFRFSGHDPLPGSGFSPDPAVTRFFPALFPWARGEWSDRIKEYFFSVYANSLRELLVFLAAVGAWFVGRHLWIAHTVRVARRSMPLVVGGWGTRGKSGTERLKAALFNALGYNVVSKTTGCEAMFLRAHARGTLREMFLFRSYDKATIWEQTHVLRLARRLNCEVFLWECMGLTPSYVEVLQHQWMKDDLSTITNTYPDHEDLQGPAGIDIPRVMTNFIPAGATLFTTEEQMLPILREGARRKNTGVRSVGWLEAGLLAPDMLSRFPYEEHPYNVALVLAVAGELGIDRDFALREMADRVVADLGVLKVSPAATVRGRRLDFTNGMSANERYGTMANWKRTGFQDHDPYAEPGVWLTTVVNNRADRVPRSQVFASMLVNDLMADRHVLIGTNLDGLRNYISGAWEQFAQTVTLWPDSGEVIPLETWARRFRLCCQPAHLRRNLETMLGRLGIEDPPGVAEEAAGHPEVLTEKYADRIPDAPDLRAYVEECRRTIDEYEALAGRVSRAGRQRDRALDEEFRGQLRAWFERKIVVIEDAHANGEQVIDRLVRLTPPGMYNRIMGVQNIKGTGLDFVYRWQAWEKCHRACEGIRGDEEDAAQQGLRELAAFRDYGALSFEHAQETLALAKRGRFAQSERAQAEITTAFSNLQLAKQRVQGQLSTRRSTGWVAALAGALEALLDAGDAIGRRKRANLIYRELGAERISHEQAALELQALNKRQKGGWLLARFEAFQTRLKVQLGGEGPG